MSNSRTSAAVEELAFKTTTMHQNIKHAIIPQQKRSMNYTYNLHEQVLSAALNVFTHNALLGFLLVAALAITDCDFTLVSR